MIESSQTETASTTLKYGMVGGGEGAFIGDVHRKAINMDGMADLVTNHMLSLTNIKDTETLLAFKAYSDYDLERMFSIGMEE